MVKHLKNLGWLPHVFTTEPKYREGKEDTWMTELVGNDFGLAIELNTADFNRQICLTN